MEVEAQIALRKAMARPIPAYFRRAAQDLGISKIFEGYTGA
jgi:hypothetical protein